MQISNIRTKAPTMQIRPVPSGVSKNQKRKFVGAQAEKFAEVSLRAQGYDVTNLNELVGNCPVMDLLATTRRHKLLMQVRGTTTWNSQWGAPPQQAESLDLLARALGCEAWYAFVWLDALGGRSDTHAGIWCAPALKVARHATVAIRDYPATLRYHVFYHELSKLTGPLPGAGRLPAL